MSNTKTLIEKYKAIQELGTGVAVPWVVSRIIGCKSLHVIGQDIQIGNDGDFVSITEARTAVAWYVEQLGGKVKWDK